MMCPECCEDNDDGSQVLGECPCGCDQKLCQECIDWHGEEASARAEEAEQEEAANAPDENVDVSDPYDAEYDR